MAKILSNNYYCSLCGKGFFACWKNITKWVLTVKSDNIWMREKQDTCPYCNCDILEHEMKKSKRQPRK